MTVNSYLADGGDGFTVLKDGTNRVTGPYDVNALASYFRSVEVVTPPLMDRIARIDVPMP